MSDLLIREIEQQPEIARASAAGLNAQSAAFEQLREVVRHRPLGAPIVLTGMGSSYDALDALASRLGRRGLACTALNTAELVNFRLPLLLPGTVVIAASQSGESAELVRLTDELTSMGSVHLVALTNTPRSTLATRAEVGLQMLAGVEEGPTTKSIQATMVVLAVIEELLSTVHPVTTIIAGVQAQALALAEAIDQVLIRKDQVIATMRCWLGESGAAWLVGRGQGLASAETSALVLKEAAHQPATAMDSAEFRHGPFELAGPGLAVAMVSIEPSVIALDDSLLSDLFAHGTRVVQIGTVTGTKPWPVVALPIQGCLLDASLAVLPFQLLTWSLASERMPEPGRFVRGHKTTSKE